MAKLGTIISRRSSLKYSRIFLNFLDLNRFKNSNGFHIRECTLVFISPYV